MIGKSKKMIEFFHDYYKDSIEKIRSFKAKNFLLKKNVMMDYGLLGFMYIVIGEGRTEDTVKNY